MGPKISETTGNDRPLIRSLRVDIDLRSRTRLCSSTSLCELFCIPSRSLSISQHALNRPTRTSIPIRQESYSEADIDSNTGLPLDIGIHDIEERGDAKHDAGFFDKGILQAFETEHKAGGYAREVKVIANGHCHGASYTSFL